MKRYQVYTGPTLTHAVADKLAAAGFTITTIGTSHVYISHDRATRDVVLSALGKGWTWRDVLTLGYIGG